MQLPRLGQDGAVSLRTVSMRLERLHERFRFYGRIRGLGHRSRKDDLPRREHGGNRIVATAVTGNRSPAGNGAAPGGKERRKSLRDLGSASLAELVQPSEAAQLGGLQPEVIERRA